MSAIVYNFMLLVAGVLLINSTVSMLQYRRHIQTSNPDLLGDLQMPLDIKVEAFVGMVFGIIVCIFKYSSGFGRIKLSNVMAQKNKTYEGTVNMNRAYALRNV